MSDVFQALREESESLRSMVGELDQGRLALPSGCPGWSVADVLLHLAQTNEMAAASARGDLAGAAGGWMAEKAVRTDVDDMAGRLVARERGASGADVRARWVASAAAAVEALEACDPAARVLWVAGDMAPRSLATTRLAETWLHTGDICVGLGAEQPQSDRIWHVARLVHRTLPYAFRRADCLPLGEVRFELTSPLDDSAVWRFGDDAATTVILGKAVELCRVAGQRAIAAQTSLHGTGPDAETVLRYMRTFA